jgi:putative aldouronate transport system permease protein
MIILLFITFTMFFSGGLIPSYLNMRNLNLINSRWALILPGLTSAWNLIVARNFIASLPDSLEEAAFVDGAHPLTVVFTIMLPISMPIIAVLALWTAVGHWNAWFDANIYVRDPNKMVLQLTLRRILVEGSLDVMGGDVLNASSATTTPETVKAATIIVSIVPIILFYPFLQKHFVKGVMVGSIKG